MFSAHKLNKQGDNIQPWHTPFPIWNQSVVPHPVLTVPSWSAYRFFRMQVSGHLFKNFPQFVVIHTVKGFGVVNKAEVDVFLELSSFFDDPADLAIWSLVPLPFLKPAWTSGISQFMYCWSLAWRILSITLLAYEMSAFVWLFEHSLSLPFFGIGMKTDLYHSCAHSWVFQICWHIECNTLTAASFSIEEISLLEFHHIH